MNSGSWLPTPGIVLLALEIEVPTPKDINANFADCDAALKG